MTVRNTGDRPVDELVQVYAAAPEHRLPVPHRRLVAHRRVRLEPAQTAVVDLDVAADAFAVWDVTRGTVRRRARAVRAARGAVVGGPAARGRGRWSTASPSPRAALDEWVRAIDHDEREDVTFAERTREAGDALEVTRGRRTGWVLFRDVDLTGVGHVELTVARGGSVRVEVRDGRGVAVARDRRRPGRRPVRLVVREARRRRRPVSRPSPGPRRRGPARIAARPAATVSR